MENKNIYQKQIDEINKIYQDFRFKISDLKQQYDEDIRKILEEEDKRKAEEILNNIKNS
jgi:DNA-directed RNA polymerase subunit F